MISGSVKYVNVGFVLKLFVYSGLGSVIPFFTMTMILQGSAI